MEFFSSSEMLNNANASLVVQCGSIVEQWKMPTEIPVL